MRDTVTPAGAAIHLQDVSKVFGKAGSEESYRAVDGLDLDVRPGQMLALLGKTGCGKSTIFNMIAGLTEPTSGTVRVSGRDPFAEFVRLVKENGKTAVFITHSISEALEIGDRIVVLKRPAMIAYDVSFDSGTGKEERELIRSRIGEVLAA